jgi:CRP-like cAMP-binding protein
VSDVLASFVAQLDTYGPLDDSDKAAVLALPVIVRTFLSETYVVRQGDVEGAFLILLRGFATRQKLTGDGARQIVSLDIPGDPLNLPSLFLSSVDHGVLALTNATIASVPRQSAIHLLTTHPAIMQAFLKWALVDASIGREALLNQGRRDAQARVAHFLCEHVARMEARNLIIGGVFTLPLTQEQLGDATGLTAVHVNRMLNKMVASGLIAQKGRSFKIPSIAALRQAGDFRAQYLFL